MIGLTFQPVVSFFGKGRADFRQLPHLRIKKYVKVLGLEDLPVEVIILDFVPTKIVLSKCCRLDGEGNQGKACQKRS